MHSFGISRSNAAGTTTYSSAFSATVTVTTVADDRAAPSSVAVTVTSVAPALSSSRAGSTDNAIRSVATSSSVIVSSAGVTVRFGTAVVPVTDSVSGPSTIASSVGVNVKLRVPDGSLAAIVTSNDCTGAKSSALAVSPATDTVTKVGSERGAPSSVAVTSTGVAPAPSDTVCGLTDSVTPATEPSSSVILNV